ncbi:MAG: hypothetical protein ACODAQ_12885 [Phycisphaeraceae bacterium]
MTHAPHTEPAPHHRRIRGKWVLLALALMVAAIMSVGWLALRYTAAVMDQQPPLSWRDRADWPRRPVRETTLNASAISAMFSGDQWRELNLTVPTAEEEAVQQLAALASAGSFDDEATRQRITAIREDHPDLFYADYLLATWHRLHDNDDRAATLYQQAFRTAPRAIQQQYIDGRNRELPDLPVGQLTVICYRSDGERVDESLRLVFPALRTDARGFIHLPVYRTIYSIVDREPPPGHRVTDLDPPVFQFPGQVGTLEAALVER